MAQSNETSLEIILVIFIHPTKKHLEVYSLLYDLPNERSKRHIAHIPHDRDKQKDGEVVRQFQVINQFFRDAQVVFCHCAQDTRDTLSKYSQLIHTCSRPWISTMDQFPWPGLEELRKKKAQELNRSISDSSHVWLKLREICHHYGVHFSQTKSENKAVVLLNCLLKVPNLQEIIMKCKTV